MRISRVLLILAFALQCHAQYKVFIAAPNKTGVAPQFTGGFYVSIFTVDQAKYIRNEMKKRCPALAQLTDTSADAELIFTVSTKRGGDLLDRQDHIVFSTRRRNGDGRRDSSRFAGRLAAHAQ